MSEEVDVKAVVRRIECCRETGNAEMERIVWAEFEALATPLELAQAHAALNV